MTERWNITFIGGPADLSRWVWHKPPPPTLYVPVMADRFFMSTEEVRADVARAEYMVVRLPNPRGEREFAALWVGTSA